jgi:ribosomal protein S26
MIHYDLQYAIKQQYNNLEHCEVCKIFADVISISVSARIILYKAHQRRYRSN